MNIVLLQTDIDWANPSANIKRADALVAAHPDADLFVLPEMWATGFATAPEGIAANEESSAALRWMKDVAVRQQCAVSGSLAVRTSDGCYRNRHYFVTPLAVSHYDKHHLFSYGHEDEAYTAGLSHCIAEWQGVRFLLLTCYDLRFPVWSRYGRAGRYDAIIYVANWPRSRMTAWHTLTRARAIENQCYVIAVNRVGQDATSHYEGGTMLIDAMGNTVAECSKNTEESLAATLSVSNVLETRTRFQFLADIDL